MTPTRNRLVAATHELFRRRGYNGTALKDVTAAAGATTGSLYHFFPQGKAQLAEAVITESGLAYRQLFEGIADDAADPAAAIGAFFDGVAQALVESDYIDVCPIGAVAREVASTDEDLRIATDRVFTSWINAAAHRFIAAGLPVDKAHALAATIVAALEGGFVLARSSRDATLLQRIGEQMRQLADQQLTTEHVNA